MSFTHSERANDPSSSPGKPSDLVASVAPLIPLALSLFDAIGGGEGSTYDTLKQNLRGAATRDPIDAVVATVIGGGLAFYVAERDTNPGCQNPWDGILYAATCLSVGYDNLFPKTATGHAIAAAIQTFGPALAAKSLDAPLAERRAAQAEQRALDIAILERLDAIVRLLEAQQSKA